MVAAWREPKRVVTKASWRLSSDGRAPSAPPTFSSARRTSGSGSSAAKAPTDAASRISGADLMHPVYLSAVRVSGWEGHESCDRSHLDAPPVTQTLQPTG